MDCSANLFGRWGKPAIDTPTPPYRTALALEPGKPDTPPIPGVEYRPWYRWAIYVVANLAFAIGVTLAGLGVIVPDLMRDLSIQARQVGFLISVYSCVYAAMQIPGGILADRIGPRKVISSSIFIGAIGVLIFSQAPNFAISIVGRVFTALGVSVLYVNQIKVLRGWFAPEEFATALGVASSINAAGSILATLGTAASVTKFGWRSSFAFIGFLDILVGLACWVIIRNENPNWARKREISSEKRPSILLALKTCFGNSQFILLFFVALFSYGGLTGVFVAWGMSFLMQGYHLYRMTAALLMTGTSIFSLLSAPFWGRLSDKWLHARKPVLIMGLTGSVLAITPLAALANHLTIILLGITLSIMGLFTSTFVLSYAMANELVPIGIAGIASAGLNMGPYIGQGIYQFISGLILGNPASIAADGTPIYSIQAYQMIFWPSVISGIIAIFLSLRVRETIRRSKNLDMVS